MVTTPKPPPIGTPVLDAFKKQVILRLVTEGNTRPTAARVVGCAPSTILRTAYRDPQFGLDLVQAESLFTVNATQNLNHAASQDKYWRASAWLLERLEPERFAPRKPKTLTEAEVGRLFVSIVDHLIEGLPEELREPTFEAFRERVKEVCAAQTQLSIEELLAAREAAQDDDDPDAPPSPAAPAEPLEPSSIRAARQTAAARAEAPAPASEAASTGEATPTVAPSPTAGEAPVSQPVAEASASSVPEASCGPSSPPEDPAPPGPNTGQTWSSRESGEGPVQRVAPD